jgi:predicted TPR repeat methyltransferase
VEVYRDWAVHYDLDVFGTLCFIGTDRIVDLLAEHVPDRESAVLDLGCGTGAAGVRLQSLGFRVVDGVDISPDMLAIAATKGAYRALIEADLERPLAVPDAAYDAAVSAGTFTSGHVGPAAVPGIVRVLRPGAIVAWVVGPWEAFAPVTAGWEILHAALEPIRRGGEPEATMLVARV